MSNSILTQKIALKRPGWLFKPISKGTFFIRFIILNVLYLIYYQFYKHVLGLYFSDTGVSLRYFESANELIEPLLIILYWAILIALALFYFYNVILRCNDRNKPIGYAFLFTFLPVIGQIWGLIECLFMPSIEDNNRFVSEYHKYLENKLK